MDKTEEDAHEGTDIKSSGITIYIPPGCPLSLF